MWRDHEDIVLSCLCKNLLNRKLPEVIITDKPIPVSEIDKKQKKLARLLNISFEDASYFVLVGKVENSAYKTEADSIQILFQDDKVLDLTEASDQHNILALSKTVKKYYFTWYDFL